MPPPSVLVALQAICHERSDRSPFRDHTDFLRWADKAEPLLSFNDVRLQEFKSSVHAAKMVFGWKEDKYDGAVNGAIGAVNQAIIELEHQQLSVAPLPTSDRGPQEPPTPKAVLPPEKLTIKWLYEHAPWSFYAWFFGALAVSFAAGFSASQIMTSIKTTNFSNAAPNTATSTSANSPSRSTSHP